MLLVVLADPAVVGTSIIHRRVIDHRLFWRLDKYFSRPPIIIHIVGHQHALVPVLRAPLQHPDLVVFKDNLRVHPPVTGRADRDRHVIKQITAVRLKVEQIQLVGRVL
jgi:hypothetical protein